MTQLPLLAAQPHRNRQLFSDYYLNHLLPQRPDWQTLVPEARSALECIAAITVGYTPSTNEAQTEDGLIKPVLAALGHMVEIQASLATPDGTKKPDYIFYYDQTTLVGNRGPVLNETLLRGRVLAVGDAKYWGRPLDQVLRRPEGQHGDPFTTKNPSYQIAFFMWNKTSCQDSTI